MTQTKIMGPACTTSGVVHHLPHRTRLRVAKHHRRPGTLEKVQERLKKVPGVKEVAVNDRTGSVLVHHEPSGDILETICSALADVALDLFDAAVEMEECEVPGLSILARMLRSGLGRADTKVASATDNWIDLKMLVPIALFGAGLWKSVREKGWMGEIPAFVLFYYAYDSYIKFHGPSVRAISATEREVEEDGKLENPTQQELRRRAKRSQ